MKKPTPKGLESFENLIGKLAKVPKSELVKEIKKKRGRKSESGK